MLTGAAVASGRAGSLAEHLQHPVGQAVAAHYVHRREERGHEGEHVTSGRPGLRRGADRADDDDAVDGVGCRHQRRLQRGRHLGDDLVADQDGQHEHVDVGHQGRGHRLPPSAGDPSRAATAGWSTVPWWVTTTPAWISSARSILSAPSRTSSASSATMLCEYAVEAAVGTWAGRLPAPMIRTPSPVTTAWSATEPSTFPPRLLAARSTSTLPACMPLTASAVTSSGGRRPGTCAVAMTTSKRAICATSSACWAACSSAVSARAYPPSPSAGATETCRNLAPTDSICSRVSGRMS